MSIKEATLYPDDQETLGNLAISYLLNGQVAAARKTIDAAIRFDAYDGINLHVGQLIQDVETGKRRCPKTIRDAHRKKAPWPFERLLWWR